MAIIGTGRKPEAAVMHPKQVCGIVALAESIAIAECHDDADRARLARKMVAEAPILTVAGLPIVQDTESPEDVIVFKDAQGAISQIICLAVPLE